MRLRTAAVAAFVLGVIVVGTAAAATFSDSTGDIVVVPDGATLTGLDITNVEVANSTGVYPQVTFRIELAGAPALPSNSEVGVALDIDKDASTGVEGIDAIVALLVAPSSMQAATVYRYDPVSREFVSFRTNAQATYASDIVNISVPRFELDLTRGLRFRAVSAVVLLDPPTFAFDFAPDGDELWPYDLVGLSPLLEASRAIGEPTRPRAGDPFTATSEVRREDTSELVRLGKVTCAVRVGEARIRATGRFTGAGAQCAMTIPRNSRGRTLRGTMSVRALENTVKRSFTFRVT